jgi:hypothetical protein
MISTISLLYNKKCEISVEERLIEFLIIGFDILSSQYQNEKHLL